MVTSGQGDTGFREALYDSNRQGRLCGPTVTGSLEPVRVRAGQIPIWALPGGPSHSLCPSCCLWRTEPAQGGAILPEEAVC